MWLLGTLTPSYKTIANFRKDNAKALRKTHRQFIVLCRGLSLLDTTRVALDGSFFNGNVSAKSFKRRSVLEKRLKGIDAQLADWLNELDHYDTEQRDQEPATEVEGLRQKMAQMKEHKAEIEADLEMLAQAGVEQCSSTDEDARLLSKRGQHVADYNVQIVTDEVTQDGNDKQQLHRSQE